MLDGRRAVAQKNCDETIGPDTFETTNGVIFEGKGCGASRVADSSIPENGTKPGHVGGIVGETGTKVAVLKLERGDAEAALTAALHGTIQDEVSSALEAYLQGGYVIYAHRRQHLAVLA